MARYRPKRSPRWAMRDTTSPSLYFHTINWNRARASGSGGTPVILLGFGVQGERRGVGTGNAVIRGTPARRFDHVHARRGRPLAHRVRLGDGLSDLRPR